MTGDEFRSLLLRVVPLLLDGGVTVEVGGSGALLLRGADVNPGDLDLVAPDESLSTLRSLVPDGVLDRSHSEPWLTSWRYRWDDVEVLGAPALRDGDEVWEVPVGHGDVVEVDGVAIPVSPLEVWLRIYRIIGSDRLEIAEQLL